MRRRFVFDGLEDPRPLNLAVDVQDFHRVHIPRVDADVSSGPICLLLFKWPPTAAT